MPAVSTFDASTDVTSVPFTRKRTVSLPTSIASVLAILPALSGFLIGNGLGRWWIGGLAVGSVVSAFVTLRVRALLRDEQDGLPA